MNDRSAATSESSSRHGSPPGGTGVPGVGAASADRVEKLPGGRSSCENSDVGGWHEAGPAAGLLARRWALEVLRVLNERGPTRFNDLRRETGAARPAPEGNAGGACEGRAGHPPRHLPDTAAIGHLPTHPIGHRPVSGTQLVGEVAPNDQIQWRRALSLI